MDGSAAASPVGRPLHRARGQSSPGGRRRRRRARPRGARDARTPRLRRPVPGRPPVPDSPPDALLVDWRELCRPGGERVLDTPAGGVVDGRTGVADVRVRPALFRPARRVIRRPCRRDVVWNVHLHAHRHSGGNLRPRVHRGVLPVSSVLDRKPGPPNRVSGGGGRLRARGVDAGTDRAPVSIRCPRGLPRAHGRVAPVAGPAPRLERRSVSRDRGSVARPGRAAITRFRVGLFCQRAHQSGSRDAGAPRLQRRSSLAVVARTPRLALSMECVRPPSPAGVPAAPDLETGPGCRCPGPPPSVRLGRRDFRVLLGRERLAHGVLLLRGVARARCCCWASRSRMPKKAAAGRCGGSCADWRPSVSCMPLRLACS